MGPTMELMGPQMTTITKGERHRAKLRAAGLRPLQIWVPDTRTPAISRQLAQQS
jgi:glutamate synthase domain-containing protein 1